LQASMILSGVLKSGSPAPNPMISLPCAFISLAFAVMARVMDGASFFAFTEKSMFFPL